MFDEDIVIAHEIKGVHCPECGGSLLKHSGKAWCDWCSAFTTPQPDGELLAVGDDEVDQLLAQLEKERRQQRGYRTNHHAKRQRRIGS